MNELRDITYFAKGKRGIVSLAKHNGKTVLIKEPNPAAKVSTIAHEAQVLIEINKKRIGPKLLWHNQTMLVREFVDGEEILLWLKKAKKPEIKKALLEILSQCAILDAMSITKQEMTHPQKHILVTKQKIVMIDFERARKEQRPRNITQVCQWFCSRQLAEVFIQKKIRIPREELLDAARKYKLSYNKKELSDIKRIITHA